MDYCPSKSIGMMPESTNAMCAQMLKKIEAIVNKQILCTVPLLMEPIMENLVKTKIPEVIISTFVQVMLPIVEDSVRKVVKEEIQSANKKNLDGGNRNLLLKFLDEVSEDVLTGKEIKGKEGTPMRVAIVDDTTGLPIESGPESSAKVEIVFLEASENDDHSWSHEVFNSKIIKDSDKTKPHFAKRYHVYLDKGIGVLSNAKLANDKDWTKSCRCRLGARVVESLSGTKVQEAWTEPFMVSDSRSKLYGKRYPPFLSDKVWRLDHIGKDGGPCKRLKEKNISTIEEFLFLLSVDPQKLREIIAPRNAEVWKAVVDHAKTCNIDDKRLCVYNNSSEGNMSVVFDIVGDLKGVIHDSHYALIDHVPEAVKSRAQKVMHSAFENREDRTFFSSEMTLVTHFPYQVSHDGLNGSIKESTGVPCHNLMTVDAPKPAEAPELSASAIRHGVEDDWMIVLDDIEDLPTTRSHYGHSSDINLAADFGGKQVDMEMAELVSQTSPRSPQLEGGAYCNNNILQEDSIGINNSDSVLDARQPAEAPELSSYADQHLEEDYFSGLPLSEAHYRDVSDSNPGAGSVVQDLAKDLEELVSQMSPCPPQLHDNVSWHFLLEDSSVRNSPTGIWD